MLWNSADFKDRGEENGDNEQVTQQLSPLKKKKATEGERKRDGMSTNERELKIE